VGEGSSSEGTGVRKAHKSMNYTTCDPGVGLAPWQMVAQRWAHRVPTVWCYTRRLEEQVNLGLSIANKGSV
jgi:hypothetical protein